jgi:hypothetical protein
MEQSLIVDIMDIHFVKEAALEQQKKKTSLLRAAHATAHKEAYRPFCGSFY